MGRGSAWLGLDKPPPPVILPPADGLNELFRAYKKALGLKDKDIAEQLNTTAGYLQVKRHKGAAPLSIDHPEQRVLRDGPDTYGRVPPTAESSVRLLSG